MVIVRKHWLAFVLETAVLFAAAVLPLVVYEFVPRDILLQLFSVFDAGSMGAFLYFAWLLALWLLFWTAWTTYYLDMWVITDRRIVDIDQKTLFRREMITAGLEKIQDITVDVDGVLPTLFGYGTLIIYTAGDHPDFRIENAARPYRAKERILEAHLRMTGRALAQSIDATR